MGNFYFRSLLGSQWNSYHRFRYPNGPKAWSKAYRFSLQALSDKTRQIGVSLQWRNWSTSDRREADPKQKLLPPDTAREPLTTVHEGFKDVEDGWSSRVPSNLPVTVDRSQTFTLPSAEDETKRFASLLSDSWWILPLCPRKRCSSFPESTSHI